MRSATLFSAGSWALALLVGFFIWLSPDSVIYPSPGAAGTVVGLAFLVWVAGAVMTAFPRSAPRLSFGEQAGGVAPVCAAALALMLAGHGLLPHPALPMVFILLAGVGGLRWARRSKGGEASRGQEMGLAILLVPIILIVGPSLLLAIWGQEIWKITAPNYAPMIDRYNSVNELTPFRPRTIAAISPEAAGRALVAIANTGHAEREAGLVDVPGSSPRPWLPDSGPFFAWTGDSVMEHTLRGLTREERAWLVRVSDHPALSLFDTVAYAERVDPWAALVSPVPDDLDALSLPVPSMLTVRSAARLQLYRAALAMADHRTARADSLARMVLGFGLRLRDDADQLLDALVGAAIARDAAMTLADIRRSAGKRAEGDALHARAEFPRMDTVRPDSTIDRLRPMEVRAEIITSLLAHASPRPVEWDLAGLLGYGRCTNLREMIYGPTPRAIEALDAVESRLRNSAPAQDVFAVVRRGFHPSARDQGALQRLSSLALGRSGVMECLSLGSLAN